MNPAQASPSAAAKPTLEQVAARFFGPDPPVMRVEFGALTDCGKKRTTNEDHFAVVKRQRSREVLLTNLPKQALTHIADDSYVMVVADGMGGAAFGELASMLALRTGWDLTSQAFTWPFRISEHAAQELFEQIAAYFQIINKAINNLAQSDSDKKGMGTTLTGVLIVAGEAFIGHVGDSRAYLYRHGELKPLTRDHTLAQQLVDDGAIASIEDAQAHTRHMLVNCLGANTDEVFVEVHRIPLVNGDRLLLCSDGLSDMVSDAEIATVLGMGLDAQLSCDELVRRALAYGGHDNVTVIIGHIAMSSQPSTSDTSEHLSIAGES